MTKLFVNENVTVENVTNLYERGYEFIVENGTVTYAVKDEDEKTNQNTKILRRS